MRCGDRCDGTAPSATCSSAFRSAFRYRAVSRRQHRRGRDAPWVWLEAWRVPVRPNQLVDVAATLGADVAFFLSGGTALGLGRGDEIYPLADLPRHWIVLLVPGFGVSTRDAYGRDHAERDHVGHVRATAREVQHVPARGRRAPRRWSTTSRRRSRAIIPRSTT